jgi:septum site-determining protein MinC
LSVNRAGPGAAGVLEFKGRMMTLSVLRLLTDDLTAIEVELKRRLARTPDFFQRMPLLLEPAHETVNVEALVALLRKVGLVPVALHRPSPSLAEAAVRAGLGVVSDARAAPREESNGHGDVPSDEQPSEQKSAAEPRSRPKSGSAARPTAKMLTQPVRSGQQVYARGTDIIVTNTVSPGAEIIADGCIHVYGSLRGRALAGAHGDEQARIFCHSLEAELVAVAGQYRIAEDIEDTVHKRAVQIFLDEGALRIESLS